MKPFEDRTDAGAIASSPPSASVFGRRRRRSATAQRLRLQPAADHRPRHRRRLRVPAPGPRGPRPGRARPAPCAASSSRPTRTRGSARSSPPSRPTTPSSTSTSTATRRRRSACSISDLFAALQAHARRLLRQRLQPVRPHLAGEHPGRGGRPRRHPRHLAGIHVRNSRGEMVPLRAFADIRTWSGRRRSSATTTTAPSRSTARRAPGVSSGDGAAGDGGAIGPVLPPGYGFEWTGTAYQEKQAAGQTDLVLALAVLFAYLFLVALYESWTIPVPVLLSVVGRRRSAPSSRIMARRARLRHLRADRARGADRAGGQERHPDRRVRQGRARGRHGASARRRSRARGCASAR